MKPIKFLVPAIFLLALGLGNIGVGVYKKQQYETVVRELASSSVLPAAVRASPLLRIQLSQNASERLYERRQNAQSRKDFYGLVQLGGVLFVVMSGALLLVAFIFRPHA